MREPNTEATLEVDLNVLAGDIADAHRNLALKTLLYIPYNRPVYLITVFQPQGQHLK
jgi:hypothetical protein